MVLGYRRGAFIITPTQQLQAYVSYDAVTRRAVRFIETIVPTLSIDADVPADLYYVDIAAGLQPEWIGIVNGPTTLQWDATDLRFYSRFDLTSDFVYGGIRQAWPNGPFGDSKAFEPKNGNVTRLVFEFRARFNANADYTTSGIGLINSTPGSSTLFGTATDHFIQVLRNAANWELGTCDGATISQSASSGGADGNLHEFRIEWEAAEIRLYVDALLVITKTTNLPVQPLSLAVVGHASAGTFDWMGAKISWF